MNILLWAIQIILAIKLVTTAITHGLQRSKPTMQQAAEKLGKSSRFWHLLTAILTFIAALGLIVPPLLGLNPQLLISAAILTAVLMLVSLYFHIRYRDQPKVFVSIILFVMALVVIYGRFILVPFS